MSRFPVFRKTLRDQRFAIAGIGFALFVLAAFHIAIYPALFTAINKDSEEIWFELVPFDGGLAQRMSDRAVRVITATDSQELLPRHATTPTHVKCKFCPWQDRCWSST